MDQIAGGIAAGLLNVGDQLPTVRQLAVDLAINPNTVIRAYRELEFRGVIETHQGSGTFVAEQKAGFEGEERARRLRQLVGDLVARAGSVGFTTAELIEQLQAMHAGDEEGKK